MVFYLIHDKDIFNSHYSLHFGMVCKSEDLLWQFKIMAAKIILKISPYHAVQNVTYGGYFLSGNACEGMQVTGLDSLFLSGISRVLFSGFFSTYVLISLFYPDSNCFFIRISVRNRIFRRHDWKWIKKRKLSIWNPDKKANSAHDWKNTPKIDFLQIRIKKRF